MIEKGKFDSDKLKLYERQNLRCMLSWLERSKSMPSLQTCLNRELLLRYKFTEAKDSRDFSLRFTIPWHSSSLRKVGISSLLKNNELKNLLPIDFRNRIGSVLVCNKLSKPLSVLLHNYKFEAKNLPTTGPADSSCPCRRFPQAFRPEDACVFTGDLDIIDHPALKVLIAYGPKFRCDTNADPLFILSESIDEFVDTLCSKFQGTASRDFTAWKCELLNVAKERLSALSSDTLAQRDFSRELQLLKSLQKNLILVPADKASNNTIFVCKRLYCHVIREELRKKDGAYVLSTHSAKEVIQQHLKHLARWKLNLHENLPYLYWLPKMHKTPVGHRFISASGRCSTSLASATLSKLLSCVHKTIRDKNDRILTETGVRRFFIIKDAFEASSFLSTWPRSKDVKHQLNTLDFPTMYTKIPLADLNKRMCEVIDEAVEELGECKYEWMLEVSTFGGAASEAKWVDCKQTAFNKSDKFFDVLQLKDLLKFIIYNAFVNNQGSLLNQSEGIPMGTNAAPELATLYLYSYEASYIDELCKTDVPKARSFHLSFRLIDDLLSVDNDNFDAFTTCREEGGVYPKALSCGQTNVSNDNVQFCGLDSSNHGAGFRISVYDKKSVFPFHIINYPHCDSNIPSSILYSVLTGQLHRFYRLSNTLEAFSKCVFALCNKLVVNNGCSLKTIVNKFRCFMSRIDWKFSERKCIVLQRFRLFAKYDIHSASNLDTLTNRVCRLNVSSSSSQDTQSNLLSPSSAKSAKVSSLPRGLRYLDNPKIWLRDQDVANILNEFYKTWQAATWSSFASIEWDLRYPIPLHLFLSDMARYFVVLSARITFVPINLGESHWTLLAIDSRPGHLRVIFWDPLGNPCPPYAWREICAFFLAPFTCIDLTTRLQIDGFQCGVWTCWFANTLIQCVVDNRDWTDTDLTRVLTDSFRFHTPGGASLIEEARTSYVASLRSAATLGTLLVEY